MEYCKSSVAALYAAPLDCNWSESEYESMGNLFIDTLSLSLSVCLLKKKKYFPGRIDRPCLAITGNFLIMVSMTLARLIELSRIGPIWLARPKTWAAGEHERRQLQLAAQFPTLFNVRSSCVICIA